jgi:uncharacterized membrane protein
VEFIDKILKVTNPRELGYEGVFEYLIQFHISFGIIALITGTVILAMSKGTQNHKKVGRVFVAIMLGNFLLGVPLGSLGLLAVGRPAGFMTVIGALFVGCATYSGYRLAKAGVGATAWHDKAMLGLQIFTGSAYFYVAALMVVGTSLFGLTALNTQEAAQFMFSDNKFYLFETDVALVATAGGTIFGIIVSENFVTPLFLSAITFWFSIEDWQRIRGAKLARTQIIHQHLTRLLTVYSAAISAVLLNTGQVSLAVCWALPVACALFLSLYYRRSGYRRAAKAIASTSPSTAQT